jgi:hypothetical protein
MEIQRAVRNTAFFVVIVRSRNLDAFARCGGGSVAYVSDRRGSARALALKMESPHEN